MTTKTFKIPTDKSYTFRNNFFKLTRITSSAGRMPILDNVLKKASLF